MVTATVFSQPTPVALPSVARPRWRTVSTAKSPAARRTPQVQPRLRTPPPPVSRPASSLVARLLTAGQPIVSVEGNRSVVYRTAKRLFDVIAALGILVLIAPVMLAVWLVLLITTRGKPLFFQRRVGHRGRPFTIVKFRTMATDADRRQTEVANEQQGPVFKNRHDPRITRIGRILRKTSLDETPQLFNVLFGRMSLVGPRPPVAKEVAQYQPWQRRRLAVKPGLTCLWQISGRCDVGFEDWVQMDLWYLRNQSLWTDLTLLVRTPMVVLSGRGAY